MENKEEKKRDSKEKNYENKPQERKVNDESKRKKTAKKFGSDPGIRK